MHTYVDTSRDLEKIMFFAIGSCVKVIVGFYKNHLCSLGMHHATVYHYVIVMRGNPTYLDRLLQVKDLEVDLETTKQSSKENLQQAILIERERYTQTQWDVEELRRKCVDKELELKSERVWSCDCLVHFV